MAFEWTREELAIVVGELHAREWSGIRDTTVKAAELSTILRSAGLYPDGPKDPRFRSPSAIQRKGEDLRTARSNYVGVRTRGGRLDRRIVAEYEADPDALLEEAEVARQRLFGGLPASIPPMEDDELAVSEGGVLMRRHLVRERSPGLRQKKIDAAKAAGLPVRCEVCGFDFPARYGKRGDEYIEVHHRRPLHDSGPVETQLTDLALLCANCHRMIHRNPWLTPEALQQSLIG